MCDLRSKAPPKRGTAPPIAGGVFTPYLFTTGPYTSPTTALLFRQPSRVPPIRIAPVVAPNTDAPIGYFESRSAQGADLDGVLLRFTEPDAVVRALENAGAERVGDPDSWLATQRRTLTPGEAEEFEAKLRKFKWLARSQFLFLGLMFGAFSLTGHSASLGLVLGMLCLVASLSARPLASRAMKRYRRRERNVRRRA